MYKAFYKATVLAASIVLLGCETASMKAPEPDAIVQAPEPVMPVPGLSTQQRLRRALELLEEGDEATARVELVEYMANVRSSSVGSSLLRQIDTTPEDYYPQEYREVILGRGQSLSNVAETYLGSAIEFHALAKYNEIERPKRIFVGRIVKVPLTPAAETAFAELADALDEPVAESLILGDKSSVGQTVTMDTVETQTGGQAVSESQSLETGSSQMTPASAPSVMQNAAEDLGDELDSDIVLDAPATADVELEVPAETLSRESIDVDAVHRQAINAYRAQDLDTAISLWDKVLEADPSYEGARLYRAQALALKKRLKSLN